MTSQTNIGAIIAGLRRGANLTQADLAEKLGITAQAVSQWERGETMPDIMTLPPLARIFGCSVDALFRAPESESDIPAETSPLTMPDDSIWRVALLCGDRILQAHDLTDDLKRITEKITVRFEGGVGAVESPMPVEVAGDVGGDVNGGSGVQVKGSVHGSVRGGGGVTVGGDVGKNASAGGGLSINGSVAGDASAGGGLSVNRGIAGNARAGGAAAVSGGIGASVSAGGSVSTQGNIGGSIDAKGDVHITGNVSGDVRGEKSVEINGEVLGTSSAPRAGEGGIGNMIENAMRKVARGVEEIMDSAAGKNRGHADTEGWTVLPEGEYQAVLMRDGEILQSAMIPGQGERAVLRFEGEAGSIASVFSVEVSGEVDGDISAASVRISGNVSGDIVSRGDVVIEGDLEGDVDCGDLHVGGDLSGDVDCGPLHVEGDLSGDVDCGDASIGGDVRGDIDAGTVRVAGDVDGDIR